MSDEPAKSPFIDIRLPAIPLDERPGLFSIMRKVCAFILQFAEGYLIAATFDFVAQKTDMLVLDVVSFIVTGALICYLISSAVLAEMRISIRGRGLSWAAYLIIDVPIIAIAIYGVFELGRGLAYVASLIGIN